MIILIVKYHLVSVHVSPLKCKLLGASIISDLAMAIYPYIECCLIHNQNLKYFMNSGVLNNKKLFPPQVKQNKHSPIKDGSTFYCFPLPPQASQSILKPFFCLFLLGIFNRFIVLSNVPGQVKINFTFEFNGSTCFSDVTRVNLAPWQVFVI